MARVIVETYPMYVAQQVLEIFRMHPGDLMSVAEIQRRLEEEPIGSEEEGPATVEASFQEVLNTCEGLVTADNIGDGVVTEPDRKVFVFTPHSEG